MMQLNIKNFKCFYDTSVNINGLTVLAGANGFGKSSVIQALLFLRRTIEHCAKWDNKSFTDNLDYNLNVELNGAYCLSLGMSNDVQPVESEMQSILSIEMKDDASRFKALYDLNDEKNFLWLNLKGSEHDGECKDLPLFYQQFYYLNAERIGPRIAQKVKFHDYPNVGWQGEYTAQILADYGYKNELKSEIEVDRDRLFDIGDTNRYLLKQTQDWIQYLMPDVNIDTKKDNGMQTAQVLVKNHYTQGEPVVATNIGFGISYVLPIIVTGLIARKGAIMIVENPEAHLHPSAQSRIGQFLARIAQSGVKVIVETHSDHVINGIQISAAKELIDNNLISINYFSKSENTKQKQPNITEITINKKGELSSWPKGFFDQTQIDYSILFKLRQDD